MWGATYAAATPPPVTDIARQPSLMFTPRCCITPFVTIHILRHYALLRHARYAITPDDYVAYAPRAATLLITGQGWPRHVIAAMPPPEPAATPFTPDMCVAATPMPPSLKAEDESLPRGSRHHDNIILGNGRPSPRGGRHW